MNNGNAILAVEVHPADAERLFQCLTSLDMPVRLTTSPQELLELIRRETFSQAVAAAEMTLEDEPVLALLASLPEMELLVATGSPDDWEMERRARLAGADFYLPRPITTEALAMAFQMFVHGTEWVGSSLIRPQPRPP